MALIANGCPNSAAAERATRIARALGRDATVALRSKGRLRDIARVAYELRRATPDVVYAVDLAVVPVLAALLGARRSKLVIDTGDAAADFFVQVQASRAKRLAARALESTAYRRAAAVVVRGSEHEVALRSRTRRVAVVPDGVDLEAIKPKDGMALRRSLGLGDAFVVGISGHFTWYESLGGGLGSELVRALGQLRDLDAEGMFIGDGAGIPHLRALAASLGVADHVHFVGRVPYEELAGYLAACDVCLLTQTDDPSSRIRTTGKLPVYLASGRYILASRVGTAAQVLPGEMLLDYHGRWDEDYPKRLARRLEEVARDPDRATKGLALRSIAERFDYDVIAERAAGVIRSLAA